MVEHAAANPKVPGLIPGTVSYRGLIPGSHTGVMDYDEACFMHLIPGVVNNVPKIPDSYSKIEGGNPGNSGLLLNNRW